MPETSEKQLNNRNKWLISLFVTLLGAVALEIVRHFFRGYGILSDDRFVPQTFHALWEIATLAGIAYVVNKCGIPLSSYYFGIGLCGALSVMIWTLMPDSLKIEDNYYGVESRISMETYVVDASSRYNDYSYDQYYTPLFSHEFLYQKDDPNLKRELHEAERYNEYVGTEGFLFWQTGLAYGFDPAGIDGYNGGYGFLNRIELFFIVGPMVIVESFIKGLAFHFIILMILKSYGFWFVKSRYGGTSSPIGKNADNLWTFFAVGHTIWLWQCAFANHHETTMAIREILIYPDYRLRVKSVPITEFDKALEALVRDMAETMYDASGIGLAAIQINVPKRIIVMDLSETRDALQVFINPEITELGGLIETEEGCLSVPGVVAIVQRVKKVGIRAQDVKGQPFELEADEMLSVCIQHEVDHLNGKMFVDYLSRLKQDRVRKKLIKEARLADTEAA